MTDNESGHPTQLFDDFPLGLPNYPCPSSLGFFPPPEEEDIQDPHPLGEAYRQAYTMAGTLGWADNGRKAYLLSPAYDLGTEPLPVFTWEYNAGQLHGPYYVLGEYSLAPLDPQLRYVLGDDEGHAQLHVRADCVGGAFARVPEAYLSRIGHLASGSDLYGLLRTSWSGEHLFIPLGVVQSETE